MPEALITTQLGQPHVLFQDNEDRGRNGMLVYTRGPALMICFEHVMCMYRMQRIHGEIH